MSRYVAESITTDAGPFGHIGLCQLRTKQVQVLYAVDKGPKYQITMYSTFMRDGQLLLEVLSQVCPPVNNSRAHYKWNGIRSEREGTMLSRGSPEVVSIGTSNVHCYSMTSDRL